MISSLFSDSTFIIVSLMALVFTIVALSQKLNDAIKGISIVYVIFILYTLSSENTSFKKGSDFNSALTLRYRYSHGASVDLYYSNAAGIQDVGQLLEDKEYRFGIKLNFLF